MVADPGVWEAHVADGPVSLVEQGRFNGTTAGQDSTAEHGLAVGGGLAHRDHTGRTAARR